MWQNYSSSHKARSYHITSAANTLENLALQHSHELIALIDSAGLCRYASPAYTQILEYQLEHLVNHPYWALIHSDDHIRLSTAREGCELPVRVRHQRDGWRTLQTRISRVVHNGEPLLLLAGRDVTVEREQAAQIGQAQRILLLGYHAGSIVQSINGLLTVIAGSADLATECLGEPHPAHEDLLAIRKAVARGSAFTRTLLDAMSQRQAGSYPLHPGALIEDLQSLIEKLLGPWITLETHIAPGVGLIMADRNLIEQVLIAMVCSAHAAMPDGGTLSIRAHDCRVDTHDELAPGAYICIEISGTGAGLSAPAQPARAPDQAPGVSLAFCRSFVERYQGALATCHRPGLGYTSSLILPRYAG